MKTMISLLVIFILYTPAWGADPKAGAAKAVTCAACHMTTGCSVNPIWPNLANQHEIYLLKQLKDIKSGSRKVPEMIPFMAALNSKDLENIAAHFAGL